MLERPRREKGEESRQGRMTASVVVIIAVAVAEDDVEVGCEGGDEMVAGLRLRSRVGMVIGIGAVGAAVVDGSCCGSETRAGVGLGGVSVQLAARTTSVLGEVYIEGRAG